MGNLPSSFVNLGTHSFYSPSDTRECIIRKIACAIKRIVAVGKKRRESYSGVVSNSNFMGIGSLNMNNPSIVYA